MGEYLFPLWVAVMFEGAMTEPIEIDWDYCSMSPLRMTGGLLKDDLQTPLHNVNTNSHQYLRSAPLRK